MENPKENSNVYLDERKVRFVSDFNSVVYFRDDSGMKKIYQ